MNRHQFRVLSLLSVEPVFGIDLVKSGVVSRGDCYVRLARLEDAGVVHGYDEQHPRLAIGSRPCRRYAITARGHALLELEHRRRTVQSIRLAGLRDAITLGPVLRWLRRRWR